MADRDDALTFSTAATSSTAPGNAASAHSSTAASTGTAAEDDTAADNDAVADNGTAFADAYRLAAGAIARPVAVVTCLRGRQPHAITVDSFVDVSYDPPTMAVSIYTGSRMMESLETASQATISVLSAEQKDIAQWLGEPGQPLYGALAGVATRPAPSGVPFIVGSAAVFDAAITDRITVATHTLVVLGVTSCAFGAGVRPLTRWQERYSTLTHRPGPSDLHHGGRT